MVSKHLAARGKWTNRCASSMCLRPHLPCSRNDENKVMRRNRLVWLLVLAAVMLVLAGALAAVRPGFSARDQPSALERCVARIARKLAVPSKARSEKNPFPPSTEVMAEARAHFADHCAICHANNGNGNTEIGQNLYPKAPDMRLPQTQSMTDGELYYTIQNGIRLTGMPAWGKETSAE
jgi:mono/diheme cytochrome c family protein